MNFMVKLKLHETSIPYKHLIDAINNFLSQGLTQSIGWLCRYWEIAGHVLIGMKTDGMQPGWSREIPI